MTHQTGRSRIARRSIATTAMLQRASAQNLRAGNRDDRAGEVAPLSADCSTISQRGFEAGATRQIVAGAERSRLATSATEHARCPTGRPSVWDAEIFSRCAAPPIGPWCGTLACDLLPDHMRCIQSESRRPEIGTSGSMRRIWKRSRGRTIKAPPDERAATDMSDLQKPGQNSTPPP